MRSSFLINLINKKLFLSQLVFLFYDKEEKGENNSMDNISDHQQQVLLEWVIANINNLKKGTLKQISFHSGVSEKTIQRIKKRETKPQSKNSQKIGETLVTTLGLIPPQEIQSLFSHSEVANRPTLKNNVSKEILVRSALKPLYREEINYLFGHYGLMALRELIDLDFIRFNGQEYIAKEQVIDQPPRFFNETLQQVLGYALAKKSLENRLSPHLIRKIYERFNVFLDHLILELSENSP